MTAALQYSKHIIGTSAETYKEWIEIEDNHAECPFEDDHPQPFIYMGMLFCGSCYFAESLFTLCVPCSDEVC